MQKIDEIESLLWCKFQKKLMRKVRLIMLDIKIFVRFEKKELEGLERK